MDLHELLSGTDFEGVSPGELLSWARSRSSALLRELPQTSELAHMLRDAGQDDVFPSSNGEAIVVALDDEVESIDDEPEIEYVAADRSMPPAPPPVSSLNHEDTGDYESSVMSRERDDIDFGIPGDDESELSGSISQELLFSPEERESIGFAIDDALNAALDGIAPEDSWKLPMELQDTSGFQQLGRLPQAPFTDPAPDPTSSGSFERGIPDESGTFRTEMVVGDESGAFRPTKPAKVTSLAFLRDDDD